MQLRLVILSALFAAAISGQMSRRMGISSPTGWTSFPGTVTVTGPGGPVTVTAVDTQAVLAYTAPDASACTVEVSESNTYAPLVRDVDAALFPGSNLDSRAETASSGLARQFVLGKRTIQQASDNRWYSRSLANNTTHYYRVTCGATINTGSFTTANIPLGRTYN